ncbi:hypothetical protein BH23BAC1_BH23BAC1_23690 [soil metagenome]
MEIENNKRSYQMTARADLVAQNKRNIMKATVGLWKELSIHEITLEMVAERSGVTVRTILRKYGSKENLFEACIENDAADVKKERSQAPKGDVLAALKILLDNYEEIGDAAIRTLAVEGELFIAQKILNTGRTQHRTWCARVFEPYLSDPGSSEYESQLLSFIAATEFYLWKLLRRDLNKSYDETLKIFLSLSEGLILKLKT